MKKLADYYPDLEFTHKKAIAVNKRIIALQLGKSLWQDGKVKEARKALLEHWFYYKNLLAYSGTFFPYTYMIKFWNMWSNIFRRQTKLYLPKD